MTYYVEIKENTILISYENIKITGAFENGLPITNDPEEIEYRHTQGNIVRQILPRRNRLF